MWNKLFKKRQSKASNKSETEPKAEASKPATSFKCFSFRSGKKDKDDPYGFDARFNENFNFLESEIYKHPGEAGNP